MKLSWAFENSHSLWSLLLSGGMTMAPLLICSLVTWIVIFERLWFFWGLKSKLDAFHLASSNLWLKQDLAGLRTLCLEKFQLPTARILLVGLEQSEGKKRWPEMMDRKRQLMNQELKGFVWVLGTIAAAAPFIGLFGTVLGILESFQSLAKAEGKSGFTIVAAGISEALIATAFGIVVAVVAVLAFNTFQTTFQNIVLLIRLHTEEMVEWLESTNIKKSI